jgi:hypothetical protein
VTTKEAIGVAIEVMKFRLIELHKDGELPSFEEYNIEHRAMIAELEAVIAKLEQYHE